MSQICEPSHEVILVYIYNGFICMFTNHHVSEHKFSNSIPFVSSANLPGQPKNHRRQLLHSPPWSDWHPQSHGLSLLYLARLSVLSIQPHQESRKGVHSQVVEQPTKQNHMMFISSKVRFCCLLFDWWYKTNSGYLQGKVQQTAPDSYKLVLP